VYFSVTFHGYGDDNISILSWNLEESERKDIIRDEINNTIKTDLPDKIHLISKKSIYESTSVVGEGYDLEFEDNDEFEILESLSSDCICPDICVGGACQSCHKILFPDNNEHQCERQPKRKACEDILNDISNKKLTN
jgi:hypothetical protein